MASNYINKILVVETHSHYKVLENLFYLINKNCETCKVTFYVNKDKKNIRELLFPKYNLASWIVNHAHSTLFFPLLIVFGWRYRIINISTGPEGNHFTDVINVIFFYLFCILHGKKVILTIKNIRPYLSSSLGFKSFIRNKALNQVARFTFETNTMKNVFQDETGISNSRLSVSYDRYTDLNLISLKKNKDHYYEKYSCVIGLLGTVDEDRRNYYDIINALKRISNKKNSRLLFVVLGSVRNAEQNKIINEFKLLTNINYTEGWLSALELEKLAINCDIFISPLRREYEYGTYKGSGSFGDAVFFRKRIILPKHVDPEKEFLEISNYYDNENDMVEILNNIETISNKSISVEFYDQFTTKSVYAKIINDLSLADIK